MSLLIVNARLVDRDLDTHGALLVREGTIERVFLGQRGVPPEFLPGPGGSSPGSPSVLDAAGAVLMPSFVDLHAHFRDPGMTAKEDLVSASRAAAAGGYGTAVLMANTSPPCSDLNAALAVRNRADGIGLIDAFQAVSLTRGFEGSDTSALEALDPALVPVASEDGKEVASASVMLEAMRKCALKGVIVSCHCEDPELASAARPFRARALELSRSEGSPASSFADRGETGSADFAETGSLSSGNVMNSGIRENLAAAERLLRLAEDTLTARNIALAGESGARIHVAHVSTRGALDAVREGKRLLGDRVTCEVTPHHIALTLAIPAIVNPPLRPAADRDALIAGIVDGTVDAIATDHAPHTAEDKASGAPGFSGIQTAFAVCNTVLVKTGRISLSRLSALMSARPAEILGLCRGLLRPGYAGDLVLLDPEREWVVRPQDRSVWQSKSINTPFTGSRLSGTVIATFRSGVRVYPFPVR